jgi:hypothetical protein
MFDGGASAVGFQRLADREARQWDLQREMERREYDIEQRDYMNWYNSPAQQMARFEEAGLNKNLVFGGGSAGIQAGSPKGNSIKAQNTPIGGLLNPGGAIKDAIQTYVGARKGMADVSLTQQAITNQKLNNHILAEAQDTIISQKRANLQNTIANTKNVKERTRLILEDQKLRAEQTKIESKKAELWKKEINPNTSPVERYIMEFLNALNLNPKQAAAMVKQMQTKGSKFNPASLQIGTPTKQKGVKQALKGVPIVGSWFNW